MTWVSGAKVHPRRKHTSGAKDHRHQKSLVGNGKHYMIDQDQWGWATANTIYAWRGFAKMRQRLAASGGVRDALSSGQEASARSNMSHQCCVLGRAGQLVRPSV